MEATFLVVDRPGRNCLVDHVRILRREHPQAKMTTVSEADRPGYVGVEPKPEHSERPSACLTGVSTPAPAKRVGTGLEHGPWPAV